MENEGVCEIVDPDAVLGKGEGLVEKPNTSMVVKLIETEQVRFTRQQLSLCVSVCIYVCVCVCMCARVCVSVSDIGG